MSKPKLAIVIGSIRPNRFAAHAGEWIERVAKETGMFEVEVVDLKNYPMPIFAEEMSPAYAPSKDEVAGQWQKKMAEFDAYVFTAAEYNHGPTAVLKNALDYAYKEWANKPVAFVGYGGVGGARAIEQLLNAIELQMAPIRTGLSRGRAGGKEARRFRLPQPERQGHARPAAVVDQRAEDRARECVRACSVGVFCRAVDRRGSLGTDGGESRNGRRAGDTETSYADHSKMGGQDRRRPLRALGHLPFGGGEFGLCPR
jgi:NAD(P)H-dependent FMN reductase